MRSEATRNSQSSSTVALVGLGKIGLPLAVQYAQHARHVIGCDIDPRVVETINAGHSHIQEEPELAIRVAQLVQQGSLSATVSTTEAVSQAGVVIVIVPVTIDARHEVNFEAIDHATAAIGAGLRPGTLVIYETTLPVCTTAHRFGPMLERLANLTPGQDFFLAYSPERVSSGSIFRDLRIYPKVVGGIDQRSTDAAVSFYRSALEAEIIPVASTDEAEFIKLIETSYRDVNIALANEYACFADAHGLNVARAIAAANTQPYSHIHAPGVGVGGHCIPVYPYFLLRGVQETGLQQAQSRIPVEALNQPAGYEHRCLLTLPRIARNINDAMAEYAVSRIEAVIGSLAGRSALILGIAYRGDVREAAFTSAHLLQEALLERGATVFVDDPLFSEAELSMLGYIPLSSEHAGKISAIILQAAHSAYRSFNFRRFTHCQLVLDGRMALSREKIESLGMHYIAIGDGNLKAAQGAKDDVLPSASYRGGA